MGIQMESAHIWVFTGDGHKGLDPGDHRFILTIPALPL